MSSLDIHTEIVAHVYHGEHPEATHYGSVAVVDGSGKITHYVGDPYWYTSMRSSVKPFQALPLVTSGALDHFGFSTKQLAITCGSHTGSDEHCKVVRSNLTLTGHTADHLMCGTHWPLGMRLAGKYPLNGEDNDPVRHNCSGKHSGFLALSKFLGEDAANYLNPDSKTQQMIKSALADYCEYPEEKIAVAIDGCSAPVFAMPIFNLAIGFKKLTSAEASDEKTRLASARIRDAMMEYPKMVSGEKRFDYDLKRSFPGKAVCKVGAEAIEGIGFVEPQIGITVKIHDGNPRVLGAVCVEVLKQLGIIDNIEKYPYLLEYERPAVKNYRKITTGHIETAFRLRKA